MSVFAAILILVGVSAPAQSTDDVLRSYVACAAKRDEVQMHQLLDAGDEGEYRRAANAFSADPRCVTTDEIATAVTIATFNTDRGKLRGMVAENLLKRSKTAGKLAPVAQSKTYAAGWFPMTGRPRAVDEMAMCVASIDPVGIRALLATQPGSASQRQAFTKLTPALGSCLAKGYQLDTKPPGLRAALAEALYHRDYAVGGWQ